MSITLKANGWKWHHDPIGDRDTLVFHVEGAPYDELWFEVKPSALTTALRSSETVLAEHHTSELVALLLERLRAIGAQGLYSLVSKRGGPECGLHYVLQLGPADIEEVQRAIQKPTKCCSYRTIGKFERDLHCAVGSNLLNGIRNKNAAIPTTLYICQLCQMPDSRVVCVHLHHPDVDHPLDGSPKIKRALCDLGKNEVNEPRHCSPGPLGNPCWVGEVTYMEEETTTLSPLAIHEMFDYLNVVWKDKFEKRQLMVHRAASLGNLATQCTSREDLEVKFGALSDAFKRLNIDQELLLEEHQNSKDHEKGRTFARLESAFERRLKDSEHDTEELERARTAIRVLRDANDIRNSQQHGGTDTMRKAAQAYAKFDVPYPPSSPAMAWQRVQTKVVEALKTLCEVLCDLPPAKNESRSIG